MAEEAETILTYNGGIRRHNLEMELESFRNQLSHSAFSICSVMQFIDEHREVITEYYGFVEVFPPE